MTKKNVKSKYWKGLVQKKVLKEEKQEVLYSEDGLMMTLTDINFINDKLNDYWFKNESEGVLDDDTPDAYDSWITELSFSELLSILKKIK